MFISIIRTIIGSKFQIDPVTVPVFLGPDQKAPPVAGEISKCRRLYRVKNK